MPAAPDDGIFETLLEAAPDAMLVVDGEGVIERVNAQAERIFGAQRDALVGLAVEELIPERFRSRHVGHRASYMAAPKTRPMGDDLELFARRVDGSEIPVEISLSPVTVDGQHFVIAAVRDISQRRAREADRQKAHRMFESVLEAAPDAMLIVDESGRIEFVNAQAERMFGYPRRDMVGEQVEALVPEDLREAHVRHRAAYHEDPHPRPMGVGLKLEGVRADGSRFPVEISLSPVRLEQGRAVIAAVRDVTKRREVEKQEHEARAQQAEIDRLQERDEFKTQFINNAAHELNTPLTTLLMQLRLLEQGADELDERRRRSLEMVGRNAERFARLVRDLLDAGRYQGGRLAVERGDVDLSALVQEAGADHRVALEAEDIELVVDAAEGVHVEGDADRLRQVLDNLLGNALKFTYAGGKAWLRLARDGAQAVLEVEDTGRGFAPDQAEALFRPFTRLDSGADAPPGTGLGLYLCRAIVELHHGTIEASSAGPGEGATFTVRLSLL